LFNVVTELSGT